MKKLLVLFFPVFIFVSLSTSVFNKKIELPEQEVKMITTNFKSEDGLIITADVYPIKNPEAPWIILFHQAGYSRGEYRPIAPRLNEMGFNCMAVDQRSGKEVNDVENETAKKAKEKKLAMEYPDAFPDLEASLKYVKNAFNSKKTIVWGSSYSASLVFILASKYPEDVTALVAFSPGEYFTFEGKKIADFASEVDCPVFITSSASEHNSWKKIYQSVSSKTKTGFLPAVEGFHGSKALWESKEGHEAYWEALKKFLKSQL